ncbi:MAG: phospholipase A [Tannerellaceae bacterium]|nr:phospholipase A [Tannerellaceae bacterium]
MQTNKITICRKLVFLLGICFIRVFVSHGQLLGDERKISNPDSIRRDWDSRPYFSLFKDNYFIGGTTLGHKPTSLNSDVKFQISISQRLTRSHLPFDSYLFVQFTQKTFWNVFQKSLPMRDINFNPGIGLGRIIISNNRYIGKGYVMLEHESNGKDSIDSRSWNRFTGAVSLMLTQNIDAQVKAWIPIIDGENNKDILQYCGVVQFAGNYRTNNHRFNIGLILTKRGKWDLSFNTQLELSYKFNNRENQYLFLQYYNGYGESLLEYTQFRSRIRLGFVIKPQDFSFY